MDEYIGYISQTLLGRLVMKKSLHLNARAVEMEMLNEHKNLVDYYFTPDKIWIYDCQQTECNVRYLHVLRLILSGFYRIVSKIIRSYKIIGFDDEEIVAKIQIIFHSFHSATLWEVKSFDKNDNTVFSHSCISSGPENGYETIGFVKTSETPEIWTLNV